MNRKIKITVSAFGLLASLAGGTAAVMNTASIDRQLDRNEHYARYLALTETRRTLSVAKRELDVHGKIYAA